MPFYVKSYMDGIFIHLDLNFIIENKRYLMERESIGNLVYKRSNPSSPEIHL